jgi:thymidylate synthase
MNNLDKQYTALLQDILDNGVKKSDRTGTGTISVFGRQIRHRMSEGFPLLTTKKMAWKSIVTELLWFLRGDTNIKYLVDNDCHIWDGDAYKNYLKEHSRNPNETAGLNNGTPFNKSEFIALIQSSGGFAKKWGELGPIYGKQWRSWTKKKMYLSTDGSYENIYDEADQTVIDQISILIKDLKTNPDSRRLMVSAWNVGELDQMVLPPCHYGFQVYTRELSLAERLNLVSTIIGKEKIRTHEDNLERVEKLNIPTRAISLMWNQRSVDTFLGLPFNIASYGLLLEIIAKEVNMVPDELIGNLGDVHLYSNHVEQAREQIGRPLTSEERYHLWFDINYETGMERFYDPERLPDYENTYWAPTPTRTREPYPLPQLVINTEFWQTESGECGVSPLKTNLMGLEIDDFTLENYVSHPTIKAPLSN